MEALQSGPRTLPAKRALQVLLILTAGLYLFRFSLPGIILGGTYVADGAQVTAHLDSETRFLSALALGFGLLALWSIRNFETYPQIPLFIAIISLIGGFTRLISMSQFGIPGFTAVIATILEFLVPGLVIWFISQRDHN